ncbi:MAG: Ig-like domain-containing protein [Myxococcales bacterium]|nr:Ig-like domain-containing protein [Myxococcales bacterium]
MTRRRALLPLCAATIALAACGGTPGTTTDNPDARTSPRIAGGGDDGLEGPLANAPGAGLVWKVSEGNPPPEGEILPPAPATPLPDADTQKLLARLPAVDAKAGDQQDFALRPASQPPPKPGSTVETPFPPPVAPDVAATADNGEPKVLRYSPEGDVPLGPRVSVTFATPMVAVTSHEELAKTKPPVNITPAMDGVWRWVGTKTVFFEPGERVPMATHYTVEVPAGTKDANGKVIQNATTWKFSTPPPSVRSFSPGGDDVALRPDITAVFDQRVDEAAVLAKTKLTANGQDVPFEPLPADADARKELAKNKDIAGRWIAIRPKQDLPKDASIVVTFDTGTPSAEGPRATEAPITQSFRTYGPFKVREHRCGWGRECRPGQPFTINFTNSIDEDALDPAQITVTPAIEGLEVETWGNTMSLRGLTRGRTTYTVKLSPELKDIYGQKLGKSDELEFEVGDSPKMLSAPDAGMVVLDPNAKKARFSVYTINYDEVRLELYKVAPTDWSAYTNYLQHRFDRDRPAQPPGTRAFAGDVVTKGEADRLTEVPLDLTPALTDGRGQVLLVVKPIGAQDEWAERRQTVVAWVQVTQIGLDAFADQDELIAFASALTDGKPLAGVELELTPPGTKVTTGQDGLARVDLPTAAGNQLLIAKLGADVAFLPDSDYTWSSSGQWVKRPLKDSIRWMVFDDRRLYRPKEAVSLKGWLRLYESGEKGGVGALPAGAVQQVRYTVVGPRGNELKKGEVQVDRYGGFDLRFDLPDTPNLGWARIELDTGADPKRLDGGSYQHSFQIEEFRRPEFEVSARASEGPHLVGGHATMTVNASYFAGGPLPNAEVRWIVNASPGWFTPPNQGDFSFGTWIPWWSREPWGGPGGDGSQSQVFEGQTDASGAHTVRLDFSSVDPPRPMTLTGEATVTDVNRQAWSANASVLVHPANHYVGLRTPKSFVQPEEPVTIEAIVANIDGQRLEGSKIHVEMVRLAWKKQKKAGWVQIETDSQTCELVSAKDPVSCKLVPKAGGQHTIRATITDGEQRKNQSTLSVWVPGGEQPVSKRLEQEEIQLIPSQKEYKPGDTAEVLVQAPFFPCDGVVRVGRVGTVESYEIHLDGPSYTVKVPIEAWMVPDITVHVDLSGARERTDDDGKPIPDVPKRPAFASGSITLRVPPEIKRLNVDVAPADPKVSPGADTKVALTVTGADGKPAADTQLAVVVVDEAVLALTGYKIPDPVGVFYTVRGDSTTARKLREKVLIASVSDLLAAADKAGAEREEADEMAKAEEMPAPSAAAAEPRAMAKMAADDAPGEGGGGDASKPIAVRKNFDPLAVFAPSVVTDAAGKATVDLKLPDNLTRYRVMVVAVNGNDRFGSGESAITARLPLMVRMSPPRFLNFGDRFELPVVVQNQTDAPMDVQVAVRATNATLTAGAGRAVTVPANDRVEVRFPVAAEMAGTARFQAGAAAGAEADAAEVSLPVWTPATTEAFATYGEVDQGGVKQPVRTPGEVWPQFGGLDITTSSTQLQALTDAVLYLQSYPFECAEQVSSRILSVAALKDVLTAFKAPGVPSPEAMMASVSRDMDKLRGMQNDDGGWGFWRRYEKSWPFLTVHVTHALARAKNKGFEVKEDMLSEATYYLETIEQRFEPEYPESVKRAIRAYALYVLDRLGKKNPAKARAIVSEGGGLDKLGLETVGWLYPVFMGAQGYEADLEAVRKLLGNSVTETAGNAHFVTGYSDGAYLLLHSDRRVDAILLEDLIADQPKSDLITKIVRGLLAHRTKGRWANTQESAWVLLALDTYFNTYEKVEPNFVASVWLGDQFAGQHEFKGRTTEEHEVKVPMSWLAAKEGPQDLVVAKKGEGRLYYRLGMRYAPKDLKLAPADHGFVVERRYEAVDDTADVKRGDDGRYTVKAGATVKVTVTMVAPERRYHVALVDPMPAGFEALNPALKGTAGVAPQSGGGEDDEDGGEGPMYRGRWWWWGPWYEHQNLRDERAEAFTSLLWDGVYTYTYYARATTPGDFVVPPPKAEEMYAPETFGRGQTDFVTVK